MSGSQPKYLTVADAVQQVTGQRPSPPTLWRWATKGTKGVLLKTWLINGKRCSTIEAVETFIEESTLARTPPLREIQQKKLDSAISDALS